MNTTTVSHRLESIAIFVCDRLREMASQRQDANLDPEYRWQHILRVSQYGRMIAKAELADVELVIAACLLHDVARFDQDKWKEHGRLGARIVRPLLAELGYSPEEMENICYSVAAHVDGRAGFPHPETLESKIVRDADSIDRFGAYRIIQWCTADVENYEGLIAKIRPRLQTLEDYRRRRVMETESGHHLFIGHLDLLIAFLKALVEESELTSLGAACTASFIILGEMTVENTAFCKHVAEEYDSPSSPAAPQKKSRT